MKERITVGYIGLGRRGTGVLQRSVALMSDVKIKTLCDLEPSRVENAANIVEEIAGYRPGMTTDYHEILADPEIDAVFIMTYWSGRPGIAMDAMRAGKYAAIEVGCADTLQECYDLVRTYEETGVPLMLLENCCYGRRELMLLNMVRQGLFGEVIHCSGGYMHYLPKAELFLNIETETPPHYRLPKYIAENRENYPTHELGPIAKILNINRGNRFVKLTSVASKARGLKTYAQEYVNFGSYADIDYKQGDIVNTILTCANGETVSLTLDTTLPRAFYSRAISVRGTKGMSNEDARSVYLVGMEKPARDNEEQFYEKYDHPLQREFQELGPQGGHGGMDWLVCRAFIESVKTGTNPPIDVYDAATWLAVGALSARSIREERTVDFPDFTHGLWMRREPALRRKYGLEEVVEDLTVPIFPTPLEKHEADENGLQ